jgi:hypothetical protein
MKLKIYEYSKKKFMCALMYLILVNIDMGNK